MKKKLLIAAVLCIVLAISTAALATSATFNETMPSMGHKTLATGIKSNNVNEWMISLYSSTERSDSITVWIDANGSPAISNQSLSRGQTITGTYAYPTPAVGSNMALRTQPIDGSLSGGWYVRGFVNFN